MCAPIASGYWKVSLTRWPGNRRSRDCKRKCLRFGGAGAFACQPIFSQHLRERKIIPTFREASGENTVPPSPWRLLPGAHSQDSPHPPHRPPYVEQRPQHRSRGDLPEHGSNTRIDIRARQPGSCHQDQQQREQRTDLCESISSHLFSAAVVSLGVTLTATSIIVIYYGLTKSQLKYQDQR